MNDSQDAKTATTLPAFSGAVNYAPIEPLQRLQGQSSAKRQPHYICDALRERYQHFTSLDRSVRNEMLNVGMTIENFMQGKQFAVPDYLNGGIRTVSVSRDDGKSLRPRAVNLVSFYRTVFSSRWMSANPDVYADAADDDDDAIEAAKAADAQIDHYENEFFTPWFNWQEGSAALSWGTYITRLRHDAGVRGVAGLRKLYGEKTVVVPGEGDCPDCNYKGEDTEFSDPQADPADPLGRKCPACGSPNVLLKPPQEIPIQTLQGVEPVNLGELRLDQLPFAACWWDLRVKPEDSNWFIYNQRVALGQVSQILQGAKLPEAKSEDRGLQILEALTRSGQALSGYSRHGRTGKELGMWAQQATLNEMWLSPQDYADIECKGNEETLSGETLPVGSKLVDVFPDGLVAVGLNDMAVVIGLYGEQHGPALASGVYDIRSHSGAGRGAADVVDTQQRVNKLHTQFERSADAQSFAYLSDAVSPSDAQELTKPNKAVPFDLSGFPEVKRLQDAIYPIQQTAFAPQFMEYAFTHLNNIMQLQFRTVDFAGGLPSVDNKTATGAQIAASLANGLFKPMASIKADVRKRNAWQILQWCRRFFPVERQYSAKGRNGKSRTVKLAQVELSRIVLKVTENSEMPQNDVIRQMRTTEYIGTVWGGMANYLMARKAEPQMVAAFDRIYDFRLEGVEQADETRKVVNRRIRQLQQLIGVVGDPLAVLNELQPPVQMGEPEHEQKALICSEWLDSDEGLDAPLPLRFAVEFLGRTHLEMAAQRAAVLAGVQGQMAGLAQPPQSPDEQEGQPGQKQPRPQPQGVAA